ncbi:YecA family protein [Clostridium vincentii]|uniref:SEC-C motif protein n=1 Tax=Clostridium vincentii TaxID=52704 RepID=A0A2T0B761_9CLOT|nr:SEC-C domain-containing protein [Clostridium vincentii]PRR79738.1 hypothetical protein CLVI_32390 [Clostridium vincentii]
MSKIGRNEPCPCGSGKKHKNCCIDNSNNNVVILPTNKLKTQFINEFKKNPYYKVENGSVIPIHEALKSSRNFTLAILEQMIGFLSSSEVRDDLVNVNCNDLIKLVDMGDEYFYNTIIKEILEVNGHKQFSIDNYIRNRRASDLKDSLTNSEKIILNHVAINIISEYRLKSDFKKLDYGAMKVLTEFAHQIILKGIDENINISGVTIYIDKDELKSWEIHVEDSLFQTIDVKKNIYLEWEPLSVIDNFNSINKTELCGLTSESQKKLATALTIEKLYGNDDNSIFSFSSLVIEYFGVVEKELGNIIRLHEKSPKPKRRMWNDLCNYFESHNIPQLSEKLPIYDILRALHPIRNKAAHGEFITKEDFDKVKSLTYSNRLIEFISLELTRRLEYNFSRQR